MNERIEEFSIQCIRYKLITEGARSDFDYKKFAELIVKEAGAYLMQPEFIGRSDLDWSMVLNEHFGVEE